MSMRMCVNRTSTLRMQSARVVRHSIDILRNKDNPKRRDVVRNSFGFNDHLCDLIEKNIE